MTNEKYTMVETNRERAITARGAHHLKTHNGKGGMKTPSDYLTRKEREALSGPVESANLKRPMQYEEFIALSPTIQELYMKSLIENYHGTTEQIASMLGISKSALKNLKSGWDIKYPKAYDTSKWELFIRETEPSHIMPVKDIFILTYNEFKILDENTRRQILNLLIDEFDLGATEISEYFQISRCCSRNHLTKLGFPIHNRGWKMSKENKERFDQFMAERNNLLGNNDTFFEKDIPEDFHEESTEEFHEESVESPSTQDGSEEDQHSPILEMNITLQIDNWEQLYETLKSLPINKGTEIHLSIG